MAEIDVGEAAIDRDSVADGDSMTLVNKGNPANATGTIDACDIYVNSQSLAALRAGTFSASGNTLTCRDSESVAPVSAGLNEITGLDIDIESGDYIGLHAKTGSILIEYDTSGYGGLWGYAGDCIDPSDSEDFTLWDGDAISLYGTGETAAVDYPRTSEVSLGMATSVLWDLGLSAQTTMGFATTSSRALEATRSASNTMGFVTSVIRLANFKRAPSLSMGLATTVNRLACLTRTSSLSMGLEAAASRIITITRSASNSLGFVTSVVRDFPKIASVTMGTALEVSRSIVISRTSSVSLGFVLTVSRALEIYRSASSTLGTSLTVSRALAMARGASNTLGFTISIQKAITLSSSVSLGFDIVSGYILKQLRRLAKVGTNRLLDVVGTNRILSKVGTNRVLSSAGTNRDLSTVGDNRELEDF